MSREVILYDGLQCGSITLLVGYLCIPWCELPYEILMRGFIIYFLHTLFSLAILFHIDNLVVSLGITF